MTHLPTAEHFSFLFIGQILAFSLCFIVVERITRPVVIWLFSNLLTAIGYGMAPLQMLPNADEALVVGGFFTLFAGALKAFAFSDRHKRTPHLLRGWGVHLFRAPIHS